MRPTRERVIVVQTLMDIDINQSRPVCISLHIIYKCIWLWCFGLTTIHRSSGLGIRGRGRGYQGLVPGKSFQLQIVHLYIIIGSNIGI